MSISARALTRLICSFSIIALLANRLDANTSSSSMTVVAPGLITDRTRAEARVSIRNSTNQSQTYGLEVYLDSPLGRQTLATRQITVGAGGQELHSSWFSTQGLGGSNTVRYRVTAPGESEMAGDSSFTVAASETRAVPLITAAWIDPGAVLSGIYPQRRPVTAQDVRNKVNAAKAVGIDTLIISYSEYILNGWGTFYPSQHYSSVANFDVVGTILDQASQNRQKVFVGLGRGNDLLLTWNGFNDSQRNAAAHAHGTQIATELWNLYADEPSFYGWYLAHEANEIGPASESYYDDMVDILRSFAADKPVIISPAGTPIISPQILANSHVDVFAYQDAVGAGYVPYVYTFDPQQRIDTLNAVFSSYAAAHAPVDKHLWANLENWQMDGPSYGNAYPADISRVLQQLEIEKHYVDVISSYELLGFMEHPESTVRLGGVRAVDLYNGYRDYYEQVRPTLKIVNYVANPGFEEGVAGDGVTPHGWIFTGNGVTQTVSLSSDTPTASAASVSLRIDQASDLPWLIQDVHVREGAEYQFSAWAKEIVADPSGGWLAAQVWMLSDSGAATILDSTALFFSDDAWGFQSSLITAPAGATVARIVLGIQNNSFGVGTGHYLLDGVALVGAALPIPGDYNRDGAVNVIDYDVWKSAFGSTADLRADGDGDGTVTAADYVVWRDALTSLTSAGAAIDDFTVVPEPSTHSAVACMLLMAGAAKTRRRSSSLFGHCCDRSIIGEA